MKTSLSLSVSYSITKMTFFKPILPTYFSRKAKTSLLTSLVNIQVVVDDLLSLSVTRGYCWASPPSFTKVTGVLNASFPRPEGRCHETSTIPCETFRMRSRPPKPSCQNVSYCGLSILFRSLDVHGVFVFRFKQLTRGQSSFANVFVTIRLFSSQYVLEMFCSPQ